jgi:hypothetical protein
MEEKWRFYVSSYVRDYAKTWWQSLNELRMLMIFDEEFEQVLLDKWSHMKCRDKDITKGLFSCGKSIL